MGEVRLRLRNLKGDVEAWYPLTPVEGNLDVRGQLCLRWSVELKYGAGSAWKLRAFCYLGLQIAQLVTLGMTLVHFLQNGYYMYLFVSICIIVVVVLVSLMFTTSVSTPVQPDVGARVKVRDQNSDNVFGKVVATPFSSAKPPARRPLSTKPSPRGSSRGGGRSRATQMNLPPRAPPGGGGGRNPPRAPPPGGYGRRDTASVAGSSVAGMGGGRRSAAPAAGSGGGGAVSARSSARSSARGAAAAQRSCSHRRQLPRWRAPARLLAEARVREITATRDHPLLPAPRPEGSPGRAAAAPAGLRAAPAAARRPSAAAPPPRRIRTMILTTRTRTSSTTRTVGRGPPAGPGPGGRSPRPRLPIRRRV